MVTALPSLFSFAKFLELMLYSSTIYTLSHPLCAHTSPSSSSKSLPASRFNIIRHFSLKSYQVSFTLSLVDEIFDLRMPRLQFTRDGRVERTPAAVASNTMIDDTDKKELRQEIKHWWQAVAEHLDKVVSPFSSSYLLYLNLLSGGRVHRHNSPLPKESTPFTL
jgi:1-phosphatidylinositol-3-phosphate 5-kinase